MSNLKNIQDKLEGFIVKYYTNDLLRGIILFFTIGLLYFLLTLFVEHSLWLNTTMRTILFWMFILVEVALFFQFILRPLLKLFKFQKGINHKEASKIIGNYFPEVSDKLLNAIQLSEDSEQSELLMASIEQKAKELTPIPFKLAINFKRNTKYLKYAAIPILIIILSYVLGKYEWFSNSYQRVVNYQTVFNPPAPFRFYIVNDSLRAIQNKPFTLLVNTIGDVIPENIQINYNKLSYYLKQTELGTFEYTFSQPVSNIEFNLFANNVTSKTYNIEVLNAPTLLSFDMVLDYPTYTQKLDETIKNTGNAIVPQGTKVTWNLNTKATNNVKLYSNDSVIDFIKSGNKFHYEKRVFKSLDYSFNTSNSNLVNYERLAFSINVIKDEYPELMVKMEQDSLDSQTLYFYGQASDDYGLKKLQLVYYPTNSEEEKKIEIITISKSNFDEFINVFPNQIPLIDGVGYELYFEVFDNDVFNNYKSTKSNTFTYRKLTQDELKQEQLNQQIKTLDGLNNSLEKLDEQDEELKKFSKTQKEKSELNFNDKKKLEYFLERQKQQDQMMKNFNKKLKDNLEEFQNENNKNDIFKENLKQRLQENQEQLEKDEELLKEIEKISEKIQKEALAQKLEELAKQNKNRKRSLEQLLELTKRYYVAMKTEKLKTDLEKLSKAQEKLANESKENNSKQKQDLLNSIFDEFQKELDELRKDNKELREPLDLPQDVKMEEDIKKDQKNASESLERKEQNLSPEEQDSQLNNAKKNQKKAAQKMKQMSEQMSQSMSGSGGQQMSEDIDMLRQILDNLVLFSFSQEEIMNQFKSIQINHNSYAKYLRKQQSLREHFEHIDDSLFALSLRQPMLSEQINKEITEVFFNIDKSLTQLSENRLYQGVSAQQYTVTAANTLASFLSDILDNMENQMMPSPGKGQGGEMQLPDIIMSQEDLNKQMEEGLKKGNKGKTNEDDKDEDGKPKDGNYNEPLNGNGEGNSEELNGELFKIFQQQQRLRQALEDKIGSKNTGLGKNLLRKMEQIEQDLLNKGFTNRTLEKMLELQHQLLKLDNATFEQGHEDKRQSKTSLDQFNNAFNKDLLLNAKQYFNTTEILNRQALPLQQVYKNKVKEYFKKNNDQL